MSRTLTLPDGRKVLVQFIGEGHTTQAYYGLDRWVYLLTHTDTFDPAKEVLTALVDALGKSRDPYVKHIPWIEYVGDCSTVPGAKLHSSDHSWHVHRMPYYRRVSRSSKHNLEQAKMAWDIYKEVVGRNVKAPPRLQAEKEINLYMKAVDIAGRRGKLDRDLADAICLIATWLDIWAEQHADDKVFDEEGFVFEFPTRNLAEDDDGNLVLLDVFFWDVPEPDESEEAK
jgi:hypothetical protein